MIRILTRNLLFTGVLAVALFAPFSVRAQSAGSSAAGSGPVTISPAYELAREISIHGSIQKIETVTAGGILGTHVRLLTAQGLIDAHLGSGAVASAKTLGLTIGQTVSLTGMMVESNGDDVLLARVLSTSNHIFILRNEHGLPARAIVPRAGPSAATQKGGL
jgi:hypothetical protein